MEGKDLPYEEIGAFFRKHREMPSEELMPIFFDIKKKLGNLEGFGESVFPHTLARYEEGEEKGKVNIAREHDKEDRSFRERHMGYMADILEKNVDKLFEKDADLTEFNDALHFIQWMFHGEDKYIDRSKLDEQKRLYLSIEPIAEKLGGIVTSILEGIEKTEGRAPIKREIENALSGLRTAFGYSGKKGKTFEDAINGITPKFDEVIKKCRDGSLLREDDIKKLEEWKGRFKKTITDFG